ncbi:hypothetical protein FG386_003175 [Cryptosporidium ryanae]|uniref:uncharacterized protein n=1 Tax=Cryptosporidium ryanae TaxID=515981 RepID=UPI00351A841D|nr:hypothetical protein FG386_003175 [Cryptosporidium ryanae]
MAIINYLTHSISPVSNKNQNKGYISTSILPFIKVYKYSVINSCKADERNIFKRRIQLYSDFTYDSILLLINYFRKLSIASIKGVDKKWLLSQIRKITLFLKHIEMSNKQNVNLNYIENVFSMKNQEISNSKERHEAKIFTNYFNTDFQKKYNSFLFTSKVNNSGSNSSREIIRRYVYRSKSFPHIYSNISADYLNPVLRNTRYSATKRNILTPYIDKKTVETSTYNRIIGHQTLIHAMMSNIQKKQISKSYSEKPYFEDVITNQKQTKINNMYTNKSHAMRSISAIAHLNKASTCLRFKFCQDKPSTEQMDKERTTKQQDHKNNSNFCGKYSDKNHFKEQKLLVSLTKVTLEGPYEYN